MKTIREYIDQLDEISRRDFLKGAGAAAGLAAVGDSGAITADQYGVNFTEKEYSAFVWALILYYFIKNGEQGPIQNQAVFSRISKALGRIVALPGGKQRVNKGYSYYKEMLDELKIKDPTEYQKWLSYANSNYEKIIRDCEGILEFGQAPTQQQLGQVKNAMASESEELEETSEDPIAKIDALFRDR